MKNISRAGAIISAGFLFASAVANYLFGMSLGKSSWEAHLYGFVGILAVAMNALAPFFISWSVAASRRATTAAVSVLWSLCLIYSTTSALGFAAINRETVADGRQISRDAYADTRRELLDLEARRAAAKQKDRAALEQRIDSVRKRLESQRSNRGAVADAQSTFLSALTFNFVPPHHMRVVLVALFALMVEMGATLGLFASLTYKSSEPQAAPRWKPKSA